jgi:SAM-dependent methyltransferase
VSLNLKIRRLVPSISRITYIPVVKLILDSFDVIPGLVYREFRDLPPNHLRCRVGVGNRLFANQALHLRRGASLWLYWFAEGWCDLDSDIVEIGVGCGRWARHVRDLNHHGDRFRGRYLGIDVDAEALDWCRAHFDERFDFVQSTHSSASYPNASSSQVRFPIPRADGEVDLIIGLSVFSHLLEDEALNYLEEGARVLRPGGRMAVTCFCLDLNPRTMGNRHSFQHRLGHSYVESLAQPQAAVAYESEFLCKLACSAGFSEAGMMHGKGDTQPMLVCTR